MTRRLGMAEGKERGRTSALSLLWAALFRRAVDRSRPTPRPPRSLALAPTGSLAERAPADRGSRHEGRARSAKDEGGRTELLADVGRGVLEVLGPRPVRHLAGGEAGREDAVGEPDADGGGGGGGGGQAEGLAEECSVEHGWAKEGRRGVSRVRARSRRRSERSVGSRGRDGRRWGSGGAR